MVISAAVLAFTLLPFPTSADEHDAVAELMEKTHEGKNSPWKKAKRAAGMSPIDWESINMALPRLEAMSKALATAKSKDVRDSADGYVDAVKKLTTQAKKKDVAGIRAALMALANSCADCHFKGGPGGELED
jgi:cytochrome c556